MLLDNRFYNMLCRDLFHNAIDMDDFVIYHNPDGGDNPTERNKRYENTLRKMEKYFHEKPDPLVWEPAQSVSSKRPRDSRGDLGDGKTTDEDIDEIITIRVRDQTGDEMFFKVQKNTKLEKVKSAYAQRTGIGITHCAFLQDGQRVADNSTPGSLAMKNGDFIDAILEIAAC